MYRGRPLHSSKACRRRPLKGARVAALSQHSGARPSAHVCAQTRSSERAHSDFRELAPGSPARSLARSLPWAHKRSAAAGGSLGQPAGLALPDLAHERCRGPEVRGALSVNCGAQAAKVGSQRVGCRPARLQHWRLRCCRRRRRRRHRRVSRCCQRLRVALSLSPFSAREELLMNQYCYYPRSSSRRLRWRFHSVLYQHTLTLKAVSSEQVYCYLRKALHLERDKLRRKRVPI